MEFAVFCNHPPCKRFEIRIVVLKFIVENSGREGFGLEAERCSAGAKFGGVFIGEMYRDADHNFTISKRGTVATVRLRLRAPATPGDHRQRGRPGLLGALPHDQTT